MRNGAIIGKECIIGKSSYIDKDVIIGDKVKIQNFVSIYKGVKIEKEVFIGPSVTFSNDLYPRATIWNEDKIVPTIIKEGVSIGANSTILCGITIDRYAMIGAGSVVTKDVPPFTLVFGNPAKIRGHVCYCGKKLSKIISENKDKTIYLCDCGKEIGIENKH